MAGVIDPEDYDPRYNGAGSYEDWLMNVLAPDELVALNITQVILIHRKLRAQTEAGVKPKKHAAPKLDMVKLGLQRPVEKLRVRRLADD